MAGRTRTLAVGVAAALVVLELLLRLAGRGPWQERERADDVPRMHEPDVELGWQNRPGTYVFGREEPIRMTFWSDHSRATAPEPVEAGPLVLLLGDSFTQGWAVSDEHTFGWRLQAALPQAIVRNYGSAGYGATQALLSLERLARASAARPSVVVYGFSDFQEGRNVATSAWLRDLAQVAHRGYVAVPYATLGPDGGLRFHPPEAYPAWPLHRRSAIVATLEGLWADVRSARRSADARAVTDRLLIQLDRTVRAQGGRLLVVTLSQWMPGSFRHYVELLEEHGIGAADCRHPKFLAKEMQVPVYGHPNATMNAHWASCIERAIGSMRQDVGRPPG